MTANLKPATGKARALLKKLQALAERGIDGEKTTAQRKITRLKAQFDFTVPELAEPMDLFQGSFKSASQARWIYSFAANEVAVANSVKWAIETATQIPCVHRGRDLLAEATPSTAKRLTAIATHIADSFRALIARYSAIAGVSVADRRVLVMGLYDGMMHQERKLGQSLPKRPVAARKPKGKKGSPNCSAELHVHPYTVGVSLGKQIRLSATLAQVVDQLEAVTQGKITCGSQIQTALAGTIQSKGNWSHAKVAKDAKEARK